VISREKITAMTFRVLSGVRFASCVLIFAALAMAFGCRGYDPIVWKKDIPSPDGAWIATARTDQWGGFGSAWVETTVSVRRVNGTVNRGKPFDIFSYPGGGMVPKTYVLSDDNADKNLQMTWVSPTHLQICHRSAIEPDLEVVRLADLDISFQLNSAQP
jgi:hypothetical protein